MDLRVLLDVREGLSPLSLPIRPRIWVTCASAKIWVMHREPPLPASESIGEFVLGQTAYKEKLFREVLKRVNKRI